MMGGSGCLSTHRDAPQRRSRSGSVGQMSGNSAIRGSTAKSASKIAR